MRLAREILLGFQSALILERQPFEVKRLAKLSHTSHHSSNH